jgi:hypothetical protein
MKAIVTGEGPHVYYAVALACRVVSASRLARRIDFAVVHQVGRFQRVADIGNTAATGSSLRNRFVRHGVLQRTSEAQSIHNCSVPLL